MTRCVVSLLLTLGVLAGCDQRKGVPSNVLTSLDQAQKYELLSLDPLVRGTTDDHFHGWKVLGRTTVDDPSVRKKLNDALKEGARVGAQGPMACFNPRHGIRTTRDGKTLDLVICFECVQVYVYEGKDKTGNFLISASPEATFDDVLRAGGVPLAKKVFGKE